MIQYIQFLIDILKFCRILFREYITRFFTFRGVAHVFLKLKFVVGVDALLIQSVTRIRSSYACGGGQFVDFLL